MLGKCTELVESYPFASIAIDSDGKVIAINSLLESLLLVDKNTLVGLDFASAFQCHSFSARDLSSFITQWPISNVELYGKFKPITESSKGVRLTMTTDSVNNVLVAIVVKSRDWRVDCAQVKNELSLVNFAVGAANIGVWEYNLGNKSSYFSETSRKLLNINSNDSFNWPDFLNLIYEEDKGILEVFFEQHIELRIPLQVDFRAIINGQLRWFQLRGEAAISPDSSKSIRGSLIDCTHDKEIVTELNGAMESKRIAMQAGQIGTWYAECDEGGHWHWTWDEMTNHMFGFSAQDINNTEKFIRSLHPQDSIGALRTIRDSLESGSAFSLQYRIFGDDGGVRHLISRGRTSKKNNEKYYRIDGVCIDQTPIHKYQMELKELNAQLESRVAERTKELERAKEHAEESSRIKSDFLAMMSHELRTPMNGVIGSLDLLAQSAQSPDAMDLIQCSMTSAKNLVFILNDILDINKVEAGKLRVEHRSFNLSEIIDNVIGVFLPIALKNQILLKVNEVADVPMMVVGDEIRVRQILFNLLGNSLKFTHTMAKQQGIVELNVSRDSDDESILRFDIIDNGIGIDKKTQKKLFKPFIQAERSITRKYGGTGLGLAISSELAQLMGGSITLESEVGCGTTFTARLPLEPDLNTESSDYHSFNNSSVAVHSFTPLAKKTCVLIAQYLESVSRQIKIFDYEGGERECNVIFFVSLDVKNELESLNSFIDDNAQRSAIVLLVPTSDFDFTRQHFPTLRMFRLESTTRLQVINSVAQILQESTPLELENWGEDFELEQREVSSVTGCSSDILIVEDNQLNQKIMLKQMDNLGFSCDLAQDGAQGIEKWLCNNYRVILTDCHMPNVDGYQMTEKIRQIEQQEQRMPVPIVAVTGAAMAGDEQRCLDIGMSDFVSKPVQLADLRNVITRWYYNGT